ncbi:hypothetical protein [Metabacillus dongyingensis]|uniref:hypothetical protein n=1 Tax=Metabacillus dongyingensis TaxID=2874282 RepID=UPI001CC17B54|nr:hypothetical protein [Metabacillus dongyingensis]UAL53500.1 hypothetical protein K8L98_06860 [Metabacillus dongyingensis]
MQSGNIANYKELSNFRDINDFNNHFEQWMLDVKKQFTKSELVALKRLIRFSAKVAGVCNAKIGTITKATHELDGLGISRSTFKRMVSKAKDLGLLTVHETVRKNGSKSSNVYVFNRFQVSSIPASEPSNVEKLNQPQTDNLLQTTKQDIKDIRKDELILSQKEELNLDATFTSEKVPAAFTDFVKCFYNDAKVIEEYYKLVTISARKHKVIEGITDIAIKAFKALVRKVKFSTVTSTYGLYWGILNKKFKAVHLKEMFNTWWERV